MSVTSEHDAQAPAKVRRVVVLDVKHNCEQPYVYELHARWSAFAKRRKKPLMVRGTARCRKCEACMSYRAWQWRERASEEFRAHTNTLFGTFTMSPEQHYMLDARIASNAGARHRRDLRDLSAQELFAARAQAFGAELNLWFKRIREGRDGEKPSLRYLLVAETHDGDKTSEVMRGRPHYHVMLHTDELTKLVRGVPGDVASEWLVSKTGKILVRDDSWLRRQWTFGFTSFELAKDERAVWYVCKYISKAMACRVRASHCYGKTRNGVEQASDASAAERDPQGTLDHRKAPRAVFDRTSAGV